jgi:xanthine dehydrogenase accessory factor
LDRLGNELLRLLALARRAREHGDELLLATVVHVEGSSYRKPGARMLLSSAGERAGTISGGCLEAEVSRKAWWLAAAGARVEQYSSFFDEDEQMPYDLGCGGRVSLLLERGAAAEATVRALEASWHAQTPAVLVHRLGRQPGTVAVWTRAEAGSAATWTAAEEHLPEFVERCAAQLLNTGGSARLDASGAVWTSTQEGDTPEWFLSLVPAPPALTIFGAGDDAQPLATLADMVGWRVAVADGRAHLAQAERFPSAAEVRVLRFSPEAVAVACGVRSGLADERDGEAAPPEIASEAFAVVMTHSFEQDRAVLSSLLARPMRYIGVLGPRHRTERLLRAAAPAAGITVAAAWEKLHSPVGLDLGAHDPAGIALSIVAELQAVLHARAPR